MSRVKLAMTACVTLITIGALVPSTTSAAIAGWMVNKTLIKATAALTTTARVDQKGKFTFAGVTVECKGEVIKSVDARLNQMSLMADAESIEFTECESISAGCILGQETIKTLPILIDATLDGILAVKGKFLPVKKTFATLLYEGGTCALKGVQPVTGTASFLAHTDQSEGTVQMFLIFAEGEELKVGSSVATISGSALLTTAKDEAFSFL